MYKEPPFRKYIFRIYGFAALSMGIGLFNFWWAQEVAPEQPFFVPPTYIVIGIGFCAIGLHIFQRPVRRITSMELIPSTLAGRPQLRIRGRKTPFAQETVIIADPWEMTISEKASPMVTELAEADRARNQRISEGLSHMFILRKIWELAARFLEQKGMSFYLNFKYAVLQFGIAQIDVDGEKWKLDCSGYLLEDGKSK